MKPGREALNKLGDAIFNREDPEQLFAKWSQLLMDFEKDPIAEVDITYANWFLNTG